VASIAKIAVHITELLRENRGVNSNCVDRRLFIRLLMSHHLAPRSKPPRSID